MGLGVVNSYTQENITLAHDVYRNEYKICAIYIDEEGITYRMNRNNLTVEGTVEWIEKKQYLSAPLKYKTPGVLGEYKKYWAYAKKDVRRWYRTTIQGKVDPLLQKYGVTYLTDIDPKDMENVKPNQKTDRQILFWIAVIVWIIETAWDFAFPEKPKKKKSKIGGSKKKSTSDETPEEPKSDTKNKSKREKIE